MALHAQKPTSPKSKSANIERWAHSSAKGRTQFDLPPEKAYPPSTNMSGAPGSQHACYTATNASNFSRPHLAQDHRSTPSLESRPHVSARQSYPEFLSFTESLKLQVGWAVRGLVDAFRWDFVLRLVTLDPEVRANVLKSLLLNSISLLSVHAFNLFLHPLALDRTDSWLHRNLSLLYHALWIVPVAATSLYLNGTWCVLVAKRAYALRYGLSSYVIPPSISTNTYIVFLHSLATSAYRLAMIITSVTLSFSLGYIPLVGRLAEFTYFAWVDAFYCFEFIWTARGLTLSQRVRHLEERWAYYLAFGTPIAAVCMWSGPFANAALFALLLPSYIIMATHARPAPHDPYNPSDASAVVHPSPYVPIRVPVFAPVITIDDAVLRAINFCMRRAERRLVNRSERGWSGNRGMEEGRGDREDSERMRGAGPRLRQGAGRKKVD